MKCSGEHKSKECVFVENEQFKCANCKLNHSSNSKDCPIYNKINNQRKNSVPIRRMNHDITNTGRNSNLSNNHEMYAKSRTVFRSYSDAVTQPREVNNNNDKRDEGFSSFASFINEFNSLFSNFNLTKIIFIFKNTMNKLKLCNDNFTKISCFLKVLLEFFD